MSDLVRLSLSMEQPLLERLERLAAERGYTNRSEFMRDLIRDRLVQEEWTTNQETLGTVTLVYDHHASDLSKRLIHLQHQHHGRVLAGTHVHLDRRLCAEMIMVRGRARDIRHLADRLGREKGVLHAKLSVSSSGKSI